MSLDTLIKDVIKHFKLDLSVISLILVNVITLILAIIQKWDLKTIFYVYLFQTIFILFFVCIKLLLKRNICFVYIFNKYDKKTDVVDPSKNTKMVVFFTFLLMCGIAISVYFSFLVIMFGFPKLNFLMFIPVGLFFLNHLFSFIYNFKKDSKKEELAIVLIKKTIYRFLVIHFTVVCSWFFIFTFEKSVAIILSLILFFILKIPADIYFHNKEHQTTAQQFEEKRKYYRKTDIYLTKNKDRKNQNEVSEPTKKRIENLKNGSLLWTLLNKKSKNKKWAKITIIENFKLKWDISLVSLIVTNLIVIVFAVLEKWNLGVLILLYVIQSLIIGFFNFLKILNKQNIDLSNHPIFNNLSLQTIASARTILAIIFWYLYNSILFIYMLFAIAYSLAPTIICSKLSTTIIATQETFCGQTIMTPVGWIFFGISIIIFFINHLISYNVNFNVEVQRSETISRLLFMPYLRFIPVQIILVIGGLYFKSSVVIFLILKTIIDIYTHNYIHKIGSNTEERQQESKNLTNLKSAPVIIIILAILFCPIFFLLCTFFLPLFTPIFFIAIILLYKKKREY